MLSKLNFRQVLTWLPSIWVAYFFIDNGLSKVLTPGQQLKAGLNDSGILIVGVILLLLVVLFLIQRTAVWSASLLALYMLIVLVQHIRHGKPFDMTAGVIVLIIAAVLLRYPESSIKAESATRV